jgi:hypothetical protein
MHIKSKIGVNLDFINLVDFSLEFFRVFLEFVSVFVGFFNGVFKVKKGAGMDF